MNTNDQNTETTPKSETTNIFGAAKKVVKTAEKKDDKMSIVINESKLPGIGDKLKKLQQLRQDAKTIEAQLKMLDADVNTIAREKFIELYQANKRNVGSFYMIAENGSKCLVTPADAYGKVDEDKYKDLIKKYGEDIAEETKVFLFNNDVLARNMDAISKAITESKEISDEDKANLIVQNVSYSIKKGLIERLQDFGEKMVNMFYDIKPTVQIKF